MTIATTKWRVPPDADLRWRIWGDEVVVFHPPSGDTHLLNPLAAEALQYLAEHTADAYELVAYLADDDPNAGRADGDRQDDLLGQMAKLLADFDQLGLIEPAYEALRPGA